MKPLWATLGLFFYSLTFIILFITTSPALTVISLEINFFHMLTPEVIEVFFLFIILLIVHLFHSGSLGLKPTLQIFSFFISFIAFAFASLC